MTAGEPGDIGTPESYAAAENFFRREAEILKLRFGLEDGQPLTLKEIGEKVGLTRERVRQIENEALQKLHSYLTAAQLPALRPLGSTDMIAQAS